MQERHVGTGDAGCVHANEVFAGRSVGGDGGVHALGDDEVEACGVNAAGSELSQAVGCGSQCREHDGEMARTDDGGGALIEARESAVARLRFIVDAIAQMFDDARAFQRRTR